MIHLEVMVEEPSAEMAMRYILPKIVTKRATFKIINMRNKSRLLKELPKRLRVYRKRIENEKNLRILVLVDRDNDACEALKRRMESIAHDVGVSTKTHPADNDHFQMVNRIVIEELEAWFIGDVDALKSAFSSLHGKKFPRAFDNPDNGGTWERLHRFLKKNGIYRSSYPKIEAARKIAQHIEPGRNHSRSFQQFCRGVEALL